MATLTGSPPVATRTLRCTAGVMTLSRVGSAGGVRGEDAWLEGASIVYASAESQHSAAVIAGGSGEGGDTEKVRSFRSRMFHP
jgi:hypothetical protein